MPNRRVAKEGAWTATMLRSCAEGPRQGTHSVRSGPLRPHRDTSPRPVLRWRGVGSVCHARGHDDFGYGGGGCGGGADGRLGAGVRRDGARKVSGRAVGDSYKPRLPRGRALLGAAHPRAMATARPARGLDPRAAGRMGGGDDLPRDAQPSGLAAARLASDRDPDGGGGDLAVAGSARASGARARGVPRSAASGRRGGVGGGDSGRRAHHGVVRANRTLRRARPAGRWGRISCGTFSAAPRPSACSATCTRWDRNIERRCA